MNRGFTTLAQRWLLRIVGFFLLFGCGGGSNPANTVQDSVTDSVTDSMTDAATDLISEVAPGDSLADGPLDALYDGKKWTYPASMTDYIGAASTSQALIFWGPTVAMDNKGNALVVWAQRDENSFYQIFKSEYRSGSWTHPASLSDNISPDGSEAFRSQVAMDDNGNAIIVWQQDITTDDGQIFKSEYRNGSWTHPASLSDNISPDGKPAEQPQVAMDNGGNAIIVWTQENNYIGQIFKSEYRKGSWTHPVSLSDHISPGGQSAYWPQVAMDNKGNAIIVWEQNDASYTFQIFKSEYRNGSWTHPISLSDHISQGGTHASSPQVAMDDNGNAIIVWYQNDVSSNFQIYKSEYRKGSWTHPASLSEDISPGETMACLPQIAMDSSGNAIIVWEQYDAGNTFQIFKSEYRNGAWTHPAALSDSINPDGAYALNPQVAMDNKGNAIIVWSGVGIFKSEYRNGSWVHPPSVSSYINPGETATVYDYPEIAMDDNGNAIIVWEQSNEVSSQKYTFQIFKAEYR